MIRNIRNMSALLLAIFLVREVNTCTAESLDFDRHLHVPLSKAELKMRKYIPHNHKYSGFSPLTIYSDTKGLEWIQNSDPKMYEFMVKKLIPAITDHMRHTFNVPETSSTKISSQINECAQAHVPDYLRTEQNAHLILMFTAEAERSDGFVAWASPCSLHQQTLRPNAGRVNMNPYHLSYEPKKFFDQFATVLHEIYHIMGFSKSLYQYYTYGNGQTKGEEATYTTNGRGHFQYLIKSPKVLEFGKKHFGADIEGVPVEDGGGSGSAGSHWEKVALGNEVMVANTVANPVVSEFTLRLMDDSGWYQINYDMAEPFFWGRGQSSLLTRARGEDVCDYNGHTCTQLGVEGCFYDHTFQARCTKDKFSNECKFMTGTDFDKHDCRVAGNREVNTDLFGEFWGVESRCFSGKLTGSMYYHGNFCFKTKCHAGNPPTVDIFINNQKLTCQYDGQELLNPAGETGHVKCPSDIKDFCEQYEARCPQDCNLNGRCLHNNKCFCYPGFSESTHCGGEEASVGEIDYPTEEPNQGTSHPTTTTTTTTNNGGTQSTAEDDYWACPNNCSGKGTCYYGMCSCENGYGDYDCSRKLKVVCWFGYCWYE